MVVLFQILVGRLFSIEYYICCGFVINGFDSVKECFLYTHFGIVLIMNGCWILSDAFSASVEMILWFLTFLLLCGLCH